MTPNIREDDRYSSVFALTIQERHLPRSAETCTRRTLTRGRGLLNQAVLDRVVGDVRVGFDAHLVEDARTVRADGFDAQEKLVRDFGNRLTGSELAENLELPLRQLRVRGLVSLAVELPCELIAERRTDVAAAGCDRIAATSISGLHSLRK